jgi:hypothetical protein
MWRGRLELLENPHPNGAHAALRSDREEVGTESTIRPLLSDRALKRGAVRNELVEKRPVICRVTVLTVNKSVCRRSRCPCMALTGVLCILLSSRRCAHDAKTRIVI